MNPFDLRGPEFLLFYAVLAALTFAALCVWRARTESASASDRWLREPYLVAGLRGGAEEIVRVAVFALLTRRVLSRAGGNRVGLAVSDEPAVSDALERAIVAMVHGGPQTVDAIARAAPTRAATRPYLDTLRSRGLLATEAQQRARVAAATIAGGFLVAVALTKIAIALSRGRTNVLFLVLMAGASVWGCVAFARRAARTRAGESVLRALRTLMGPRRAVATESRLSAGPDPELPAGGSRRHRRFAVRCPLGEGPARQGSRRVVRWGLLRLVVRRRGLRGRMRGMRRMTAHDRFGLGWRAPLAEGILAHLDRIDVLEVVAEDWLRRPRREWHALHDLARQVPVHVHGVSLGAASTVPVSSARLDRLARLVNAVEPEAWSEHLAFVRGGGLEIGHLAAPPRNAATLVGTAANFGRARAVVGRAPLVENLATLIEPPMSACDETSWTVDVLAATECDLLLDLHNLHANAVNFGFDAFAFLDRVPLERVGAIHIAGGRLAGRLVDDHLHAAPDAVFALLAHVAARSPRSLTVILERDGAFAGVRPLLAELGRARAAVAEGRSRRVVAAV